MQQAALITSPLGSGTDSRTLNNFLDEKTFLIDMYVRLVRSAKKIVIVSHHFLVRANQQERQIVRLLRIEGVKLQHLFAGHVGRRGAA